MKKASIIITTILTSILLSLILIISDKDLLTPQEANKLSNSINEDLNKLIIDIPHEDIKLKLPLLIIKLKTGEERISSIINIGLTTEEIDLKYIENITPIKANQIIHKFSSDKISKKYGEYATILKYNKHLFLTHELNGILPLETNKNIEPAKLENIFNNAKDTADVITNHTTNFVANTCFQMNDFLIQNKSQTFNELELLDILVSNEEFLLSLLGTLNISGIEILEKSINTIGMPNKQCFLAKFEDISSYIIFKKVIDTINR